MIAGAEDVAAAAQLACLLEASAPKPGNVCPGRSFHDTRYEDFLASAAAIGPTLAAAGERPLGETIRRGVEATRRWTGANTNLGMVMLLAPLARAALTLPRGSPADTTDALRRRVREVIGETTVEDAVEMYAAIRLARPGGLGKVDAQDVAERPTVTLADAMRLAATHDGVAREYATGFSTTFAVGVPALRWAVRGAALPWDDAVVETYLALLAVVPDTLIARKLGDAVAREVSVRARAALAAGGVRTDDGRRAVAELDRELRDERNAKNPGTTADLTAAAIFVVLLEGRLGK